MTRTSGAVKVACDEAGVKKSDALRYKAVPCGLNSILQCDAMQDSFICHSQRIGIFRHVVSLVVNEAFVHDPYIEVTDWFHFFTQVWSTVEKKMGIAGRQAHGACGAMVDAFFERHPIDEATTQLLSSSSPVMMRQQECNTMQVNTMLHIQQFPRRVRRYALTRLVQIVTSSGYASSSATLLVAATTDCILCSHCDFDAKRATLVTAVTRTIDPPQRDVVMEDVLSFVNTERASLGHLVTDTKTYKTKTSPLWVDVMSVKKTCHQILPHLHRISTMHMQMLKEEGLDQPRVDDDTDADEDDDGESLCESCDESGKWTRRNRPCPFSILPVCKLQNAMVYYGWTEVKALYANLQTEEAKRRGVKRQRIEEPDKVDFTATLFNLRRIKGVHGATEGGVRKWHLAFFRTNGVQCILTFASGVVTAAHGVAELVDKGYASIKQPKSPVDINVEPRGLFRVTQTRCDIKCDDLTSKLLVRVVDPGQKKPVQEACVVATCPPDAASIAAQATFGHIDATMWKRDSGRSDAEDREIARRAKHKAYANALDLLSTCRKRSVDVSTWTQYAGSLMASLLERSAELISVARAHHRWRRARMLQKHLGRVADGLFDRCSLRAGRQPSAPQTPLSIEELQELRAKMKKAREAKRASGIKNVVFFGDGTFGHRRGNAPVPKKKMLHELAVRGLTLLLDEYNTSKHCPCGQVLKNENPTTQERRETHRVRVHKTFGDDACDILARRDDRDELATINMLLIVLRTLRDLPWPTHLLRSTPCA